MAVTQQDIARIAKVSQATVSRVLAGDPRVESELSDRVLAVIREENYRPDVRARSLRQQKTHLIGLVLKRDAGSLKGDPFFTLFVSNVVDCLSRTEYHLCVDVAGAEDQQHVYDELLRTHRVDGLILVESEARDERIKKLQDDHFPFVLIGDSGQNTNYFSIDNNNVAAAVQATEFLYQQGYSKIAMLAGPPELTVTKHRVEGYEMAVRAQGKTPIVANTEFGLEPATKVAGEMLTGNDRPDAIIAMDDFLAMGVVQAANNLHLPIPNQLGIVGFNNSPLCDMIIGGLTSVDLGIDYMVQWSVRTLLELLNGETPAGERQKIVPSKLIARGTTDRKPMVEVL